MSITILQQPTTYLPSNNQQVNVVVSSLTGSTNFQYIFDLYYQNVDNISLTNYIGRFLKYPDMNGRGVFDSQRIFSDYVSWDIEIDDFGWRKNIDKVIVGIVTYGEQYTDASGNTITDVIGQGEHSAFVYNSRIDAYDWIDWRVENTGNTFNIPIGLYNNNYIFVHGGANPTSEGVWGKPLSYAEYTECQKIGRNEQHWMYFINQYPVCEICAAEAYPIKRMVIETYDCSGNQLNKMYSNIPWITGTTIDSEDQVFIRFGTGPYQLDNATWYDYTGNTITSGPEINVGTNVCSYKLYVESSYEDALNPGTFIFYQNMQKYCFTIEECSPYTNYRLHWLNTLGGFDSFNFERKHEINVNIQKSDYNQIQPYNYTFNDRGITTYNSKWDKEYTVKSDWLSVIEARMIEELFESPEVYLEDEDNNLVAIKITDSQLRKYTDTKELYRVDVSFVKSFSEYKRN